MSRIDELQRQYEGYIRSSGHWSAEFDFSLAMHNSWPAIHRVLLAARGLALDDWDMPMPACTKELVEALRALDGDKGAT